MTPTYPSAQAPAGFVPFDPDNLPFDRDLLAVYEEKVRTAGAPLGPDTYAANRQWDIDNTPSLDEVIDGRPVEWRDHVVPGPPGEPAVTVVVIRPRGGATCPAAVYNIHGGGMYMGTRFLFLDSLVDLVADYGIVAMSVEYRLAPEHPHPAPVEDSYAGLIWASQHATELGFDPSRLAVIGASAGGGLAAAATLLARDRGGPELAGQGLYCPMLDDRNDSVSSRQHERIAGWDRQSNHWGWTFLLGQEPGGPDVSAYAAPARAADLSGLPPAFVDAGANEVMRDEAVEYALRLWAAGGQAELHVWAGAFHGFTSDVPESTICRASQEARRSWLVRVLGL